MIYPQRKYHRLPMDGKKNGCTQKKQTLQQPLEKEKIS
jgi:hypothetical protein